MVSEEDITQARALIKNSMERLDSLWEHDIDGSFRRVDDSSLFSVVYNEVFGSHEPMERTTSHGTKWNERDKKPTGLVKAFVLLGGDFEDVKKF